jgi:acyl carrier protein
MTETPAGSTADTAQYERVVDLVLEASDGDLPRQAVVDGTSTFAELGMSSLSYLRLIDSLENEYGVYVDLENTTGLNSVARFVEYINEQSLVDAS